MEIGICKTLSFLETRVLLTESNFFCGEIISDEKINERHIFSIAAKLKKPIVWRPIPEWDQFEIGITDYSPIQFLNICLEGLNYVDETFLIITMQSYIQDKVFMINSFNFEKFAENYSFFLGYEIDFVEPLDYIFFLLEQKIIVYVHHEGLFTQIHFDCQPS